MLPHGKYVSAGLGDYLSLLHQEVMEGVKDLMRNHLISAVNFSSTAKVGWDNEGESETNNNTKWRKQTRTTVLPLLSQGQPKNRKYESLTHALGRQEYCFNTGQMHGEGQYPMRSVFTCGYGTSLSLLGTPRAEPFKTHCVRVRQPLPTFN